MVLQSMVSWLEDVRQLEGAGQLEGERAGLCLVLPGPSAAASLLITFCRNNCWTSWPPLSK